MSFGAKPQITPDHFGKSISKIGSAMLMGVREFSVPGQVTIHGILALA